MQCRKVFQITIFSSCESSLSKWYWHEPKSRGASLEKQEGK